MGSIDQSTSDFDSVLKKYAEERDKRLRSDGLDQYADVRDFSRYKHLAGDPWCHETGERQWAVPKAPPNGRYKVAVVGTGFGGLTYAIRILLNTGIQANEILLIDNSAGFGGAWYWNRYPGLMCDVEASCYMPLLEETGYTPKHRYAYGPELRAYSEQLATQWGLQDRALWRSTVKSATWDEKKRHWALYIDKLGRDGFSSSMKIDAEFFILASGLLHNPKLPKLPGIEEYSGTTFHTARWDYNCTGGTPEDPNLHKLEDKKVIFVGTGATCVQAVPQLAQWADKLYVVQRTPAAVDIRAQRKIDPEQFKTEVSHEKGWQRKRRENMAQFLSNDAPEIDSVQDGWTTFPSYSALVGSPKAAGLTESTIENYIHAIQSIDMPRQDRVRKRVDKVVKDPKTAASLKPWYSGFCKRPCFHDDYLAIFNQPNVELIDTRGEGINSFTRTGIVCSGAHYEADIVVWGTGFEPWTNGSPAKRAGFKITGIDGLSMDDKWAVGVGTLHGLITHGFPNLFISGVNQTGATVNYAHMADIMGTHAAHILATAVSRVNSSEIREQKRPVIEPTAAAEEAWTQKILANAYAVAAIGGCTPSYTTAEGQAGKNTAPQKAMREARGLNWGTGVLDFIATIEAWRANGNLEGLEVQAVEA